MARDVNSLSDTLDGPLQFLCDAAETAFVLSWVGLWAYWSWLAGWAMVGVPVALVIFAVGLAKTIQHATQGEQFHPSVWVLIISLDVLAGFAISRTNNSPRDADGNRLAVLTAGAGSALQMLADAAEHDDVVAMTVAVRQVGEEKMTAAAETVARILQTNYGSASSDRRGLALESIEALSQMHAASACSLLQEISSKESDLAETAQRAVRNVCRSGLSPSRSAVSRTGVPSPALEPRSVPTVTLPSVSLPFPASTASSEQRSVEAETPAPSLSVQCAVAAGEFWHRYGYDKPSLKASNSSVDWSYENHYNTELRRCLIAVQLRTTLPNGSIAASTEVSDADEGRGQPMATLTTDANEINTDPQVIALVKDGQRLQPTPENLAWFHALMSK